MLVEIPEAQAVTEGRPARPSVTARLRGWLPPLAYLAPALLFLYLWTYRPLGQTFQLSFFNWNLLPTSPMTPAGTDNYTRVLGLPELGQAVWNTVVYILALLPFTVLIPAAVALLARRLPGRSRTLYQALIFAPTLVTPVAAAAVWRWLLDPSSGPVNKALTALGAEPLNFLRDPDVAIGAIILISGWSLLGFATLVISAGLAGINDDYPAAASLDGASRWQITRLITLPLLSPTVLFLVLTTTLLSVQITFPLIDILTQGGPDGATTNVYYLLWQYGFRNFDAGFAGAAGTVFFVGFGLVAALFVWLSNKLSFYDN
ncbi:carbohydrate ABC transporter permease [Prauserella flavalba]|uniref:Glycerol-3-phosphate ABC transporter permease n=1 Tax=Prauserella flavalba TaxID=1477506 RepID=A0A318LW00_9PSEU|nr:sugar ABC transporter permease [Prauserella flavalba]PXY36647.1 glycerol-3-phosphate ABC transporter permease [Prauserella flavalba]